QKSAFDALPDAGAFEDAILDACAAVRRVALVLAAVRERHPDLELLARRTPELFARLQRWAPQGGQIVADNESAWPDAAHDSAQGIIPGMSLQADTVADDDAAAPTEHPGTARTEGDGQSGPGAT